MSRPSQAQIVGAAKGNGDLLRVLTLLAASSGAAVAVPTSTTGDFADGIVPTGAGTKWNLPEAPNPRSSLILFRRLKDFGGVFLFAGLDYTVSGATITLSNALGDGESLLAFYRK